jgi:hypothetical protein
MFNLLEVPQLGLYYGHKRCTYYVLYSFHVIGVLFNFSGLGREPEHPRFWGTAISPITSIQSCEINTYCDEK